MSAPAHKPTVTFWCILATVGLLVVYPLSLRPACFMVQRGWLPLRATARFYDPLFRLAWRCPEGIKKAVEWWGSPGGQGGVMIRMLDAQDIIDVYPPFPRYP